MGFLQSMIHEKTCLMPYANNKDADQPVHPCSLIRAFVVHCLDSIIPILVKSKISRLYLVSVTEQDGLSITWLQTPKAGFLVTQLMSLPSLLTCSAATAVTDLHLNKLLINFGINVLKNRNTTTVLKVLQSLKEQQSSFIYLISETDKEGIL